MISDKQNPADELPDDVRWLLRRADGFLDLGMVAQAQKELGRIEEPFRGGLPFMLVSLRLAMSGQDWNYAAALAAELREKHPDEPAFWIQLAYAKRRCEGIEVAHHILSDALVRFPRVATIPFNLACYDCRLGRHEEAMRRLKEAFALDANYREVALEDEDLEPLWGKIGG